MEKEFFELFAIRRQILSLNVSYLCSCDWSVTITDTRNERELDRVFIVSHQGPDRNLVFAKAYASLAEWYSEKFGGY
jgi:hypothetical protein